MGKACSWMNVAVVVAAGQGTRMGPGIDKLFLKIAGLPVVGHTWRRLEACPSVDRVHLVIREGMESEFEALAKAMGVLKPYHFVKGGKERQDSVWNGIQSLPEAVEVVAIHDGARPCVAVADVERVVAQARQHGAAVVAQRVTDTIKASTLGQKIDQHLDRSCLWAVQTPQAFQLQVIRRAMQCVRDRGLSVTDDTAACELIGQPVHLVESLSPNPKATSPSDLPYIELLLEMPVAGSSGPWM